MANETPEAVALRLVGDSQTPTSIAFRKIIEEAIREDRETRAPRSEVNEVLKSVIKKVAKLKRQAEKDNASAGDRRDWDGSTEASAKIDAYEEVEAILLLSVRNLFVDD